MINKNSLDNNWNVIRDAVRKIGGRIIDQSYEPPVGSNQINAVENELGVIIPDSFRNLILSTASIYDISFRFPDDNNSPFPEVYGGRFGWVFNDLLQFKSILNSASSSNSTYWKDYKGRLPIYSNNRGGITALELDGSKPGAVYYLGEANDDIGHNYYLADSFQEFLNNMALLQAVSKPF